MLVAPLSKRKPTPELASPCLDTVGWWTITNTLLDELCGVIVAVSVVSAYVVVELLVAVDVEPITTCRIRKAPRKLLSDDAGKTVAAVNDAGRLVGEAMISTLSDRCRLKDCYQV